MSIGTSGCFTSSDHCGAELKGVEGEAGALPNKPLHNIVEVSITWETRGPQGQKARNQLCQKSSWWIPTSSHLPQSARGGHVYCSRPVRPPSIGGILSR